VIKIQSLKNALAFLPFCETVKTEIQVKVMNLRAARWAICKIRTRAASAAAPRRAAQFTNVHGQTTRGSVAKAFIRNNARAHTNCRITCLSSVLSSPSFSPSSAAAVTSALDNFKQFSRPARHTLVDLTTTVRLHCSVAHGTADALYLMFARFALLP
jgi:hypothetical protein